MKALAILTAALCVQLTCVASARALPPQAAAQPGLSLRHDGQATLEIEAGADAWVVLLVGPRLEFPIVIEDQEVQVAPLAALPLGFMGAGKNLALAIPDGLRVPGGEVGLQAVGIDAGNWRFLASEAVFLIDDDGRDRVAKTFRAELLSTDSLPPWWWLQVSLTAPTSGHKLAVDGVDRRSDATHVYLRLIGPGEDEQVMPVEEEHQASVDLGKDPGSRIEVWLMRQRRGGSDLPFYERMAVLERGDDDGSGGAPARR